MLTEILIVALLIVVNGALAMSELAVVSARTARLRAMAETGVRGAATAIRLAEHPGRFLSAVQIGITLVGVLSGAFSGATLGARLSGWLAARGLSPDMAYTLGVGGVVVVLTYLSLIVGELVPKQIALRNPEAVAALVATVLATAFAHFVAPLSLQTVIVAALIVLMPGLSLTTAVSELASNQLVTGTTRFAGAMTVLLKLTFGSVAASQLMLAIGWTPLPGTPDALPKWVELIAMVAAAASFAVLFRASRRDIPLVMGSAILGYILVRVGSGWLGPVATGTFAGGVFFSSLVMAALSNVYGRWKQRPGQLVRVPGIMLLVPGSVGFRALSFVMERDYTLGFDTLVAVLSAILALVAGLLFGSLLIPPRRYL